MSDKLLKNIYDFASIFVTAVLTVCLVFTFAFKTSSVDGDSMRDTLHHGDMLLITAQDWKVEQGDVVIISQPNLYDKVLVKRVIATAGQTVEVDAERGRVLVDGKELDEPYIKERTHVAGNTAYPVTVPDGHVFVMGDNRNHSADSRDRGVGMIDTRYIVGEAVYRIGDLHLLQQTEQNNG